MSNTFIPQPGDVIYKNGKFQILELLNPNDYIWVDWENWDPEAYFEAPARLIQQ